MVTRKMLNVTRLYHELSSVLTDRIKFEDLKNKLALITVYTDDKEVFLYETNGIKKSKSWAKSVRAIIFKRS